MVILIELRFEETPSQADVENYLKELIYNNSLDWRSDTIVQFDYMAAAEDNQETEYPGTARLVREKKEHPDA